jgi:uncharacterized membrane protein
MFTFHWSELLVVVIGGLVMFLGLALVMLRRRNEILQDFLTPEDLNLEEEFFRVRTPRQTDEPPEEDVANAETNADEATAIVEVVEENAVQ